MIESTATISHPDFYPEQIPSHQTRGEAVPIDPHEANALRGAIHQRYHECLGKVEGELDQEKAHELEDAATEKGVPVLLAEGHTDTRSIDAFLHGEVVGKTFKDELPPEKTSEDG